MDSLQSLDIPAARARIFNKLRKHWQRTTVHTTIGWANKNNQPFTLHYVNISAGYVRDAHVYLDSDRNKFIYQDGTTRDAIVGTMLRRLLTTLSFEIATIHHFDMDVYYLEVHSGWDYRIYCYVDDESAGGLLRQIYTLNSVISREKP